MATVMETTIIKANITGREMELPTGRRRVGKVATYLLDKRRSMAAMSSRSLRRLRRHRLRCART